MSRDLNIYGVNLECLALEDSTDPEAIFLELEKLDLEEASHVGVENVIDYRSKPICFAIAQVVMDLEENGYGIVENLKISSSLGCNYMLLSKAKLLGVIHWLELTSRAMGVLSGSVTLPKEAREKSFHKALLVCQKNLFTGEEFEFYWVESELFGDWRSKIEESVFELFYWEDSY